MAHLGVDVAAFVDGQLPAQSMEAARSHLEDCPDCRNAVRQQEVLKARMSSVSSPALSPQFLASLSALPHARITHESLWSRLRRSRTARFGVAILGVSVTVAVVAYGLGGARQPIGDRVTPDADRYAADFFGATVRAKNSLTPATMNELQHSGWPCHESLAGDLDRVDAKWLDNGRTIALTYANDTHRLRLFEQNGSLDTEGLRGFDHRTIGNANVWVRDGIPAIVAWDHDGVVYTLVTDAGRRHIARALRQLPTQGPDAGPAERVGNGLDRMTNWIVPAA
ncbi:MAG: anti-sigma factor family protein [Aeromicrobium sp.]